VVGDYEFTLHKENEGWKIAGEVFNCKYQSGNLELH
jgi:hypothetical protein